MSLHPARDAADRPEGARRSPVPLLALGLALALVTIVALGAFMIREVGRLRDEQTAISERNRKDALQLLRISNDLSSLAFLMRDMVEGVEPYPMEGWQPAFERVRTDLREALALERAMAPAAREPAQQSRLDGVMAAYWSSVDRVFALARVRDEAAATILIRGTLTQQHRELTGIVAQFLIVNNRMQDEAAAANRAIFDRVNRDVALLVAGLIVVTALSGGWIIAANRRAFEAVRALTAQLRALSWRTLDVQEEIQRSVSRELHDDFGQLVTAIGSLLGHARRHAPDDKRLLDDLDTARGIAQQALDRIRTRSQWLHPGVLDDFGLERALARHVEQFERRTGVATGFAAEGPIGLIRDEYAIHVYRIAQEALGNVGRHSGTRTASVRLTGGPEELVLEVEDHGGGLPPDAAKTKWDRGMGLVSMRERAELMGGHLDLERPAAGGLRVRVRVPDWQTTVPEAVEVVS
jgi:signal transduction histidine kinase